MSKILFWTYFENHFFKLPFFRIFFFKYFFVFYNFDVTVITINSPILPPSSTRHHHLYHTTTILTTTILITPPSSSPHHHHHNQTSTTTSFPLKWSLTPENFQLNFFTIHYFPLFGYPLLNLIIISNSIQKQYEKTNKNTTFFAIKSSEPKVAWVKLLWESISINSTFISEPTPKVFYPFPPSILLRYGLFFSFLSSHNEWSS